MRDNHEHCIENIEICAHFSTSTWLMHLCCNVLTQVSKSMLFIIISDHGDHYSYLPPHRKSFQLYLSWFSCILETQKVWFFQINWSYCSRRVVIVFMTFALILKICSFYKSDHGVHDICPNSKDLLILEEWSLCSWLLP